MLPEQRAYIHAWVDGVTRGGYRAGIYCSGIAFHESSTVSVVTANDIRDNAGKRDIHFFVSNDQCAPSPGCVFPKPPPSPAASGVPFADAWQFAQSPRRPEMTAACRQTYARMAIAIRRASRRVGRAHRRGYRELGRSIARQDSLVFMKCSHPISEEEIQHAASLLRAGKLVAFPTETVYGLGANALDAEAVARIFAAKGRPHTSPIIVHVSSMEMARLVVSEWPKQAELLAAEFWPGPLTLVLKKQAAVPDLVTAGLDTVGVRMPAHPVAMALIAAAQIPVAAPSANRFTQLSPTTAEHVRQSLGARVDYILDGGACSVGIESTVLSLTGGLPVLLRPGGVSRRQIELMIGPVARQTRGLERGTSLAGHASATL